MKTEKQIISKVIRSLTNLIQLNNKKPDGEKHLDFGTHCWLQDLLKEIIKDEKEAIRRIKKQ